jgi:hypothetical protein
MTTPWVETIRRETGLIEHICEHGVGHPVFGSADWQALMSKSDRHDNAWMVHGCDGCCGDPEWKLESLKESVRRANDIIVGHHRLFARIQADEVKASEVTRSRQLPGPIPPP